MVGACSTTTSVRLVSSFAGGICSTTTSTGMEAYSIASAGICLREVGAFSTTSSTATSGTITSSRLVYANSAIGGVDSGSSLDSSTSTFEIGEVTGGMMQIKIFI